MNTLPLSERIVLVTGASKGIGKEIASLFAANGSKVVICSRNKQEIRHTADQLNNNFDEGMVVGKRCDVTNEKQVIEFVNDVANKFDGIDVLVNNVGDSKGDGKLHDLSFKDWKNNIDINLSGNFLCTRETIPHMVNRGGGSIIHVSSANAITGIGYAAYSTAKAGLHSFSRVIATQYGGHGIRSNVIVPGTIDTKSREERRASVDENSKRELLNQYALGNFGRPKDIANLAVFLGSKDSRFITGVDLVIDGGLTAGLDQNFQHTYFNTNLTPY